MLYAIGLLGAIFAIALSIVLHELGHFIPARLFGVKVSQFMVGFGPTLYSRRGKKTNIEVGVKAIPFGGYIRMIGMIPPPPIEDKDKKRNFWQKIIKDSRDASWREGDPTRKENTFYALPAWKKVIIMMGGPFMNLVICVCLLSIIYVGIGIPKTSNIVADTSACIPITSVQDEPKTAIDYSHKVCSPGVHLAPSIVAGLRMNDKILSINGILTPTWIKTSDTIHNLPDQLTTFVIERDGKPLTTPVQLSHTYTVNGVKWGYLGVVAGEGNVSQPWSVLPLVLKSMTVGSVQRLFNLPVGVYKATQATLTGKARPVDSPVSVVGISRISGQIAALPKESNVSKIRSLLNLIAGVNLFLFLFNLLPILPLDGGHVAGAIWESIRRRISLLRKKMDPGPVDVSKMAPVAFVFGMALILVSLVITFSDIFNPIHLT